MRSRFCLFYLGCKCRCLLTRETRRVRSVSLAAASSWFWPRPQHSPPFLWSYQCVFVQARFEYVSEKMALVCSSWSFVVESPAFSVPFLCVGLSREPQLFFTKRQLDFGELPLGGSSVPPKTQPALQDHICLGNVGIPGACARAFRRARARVHADASSCRFQSAAAGGAGEQ